MILYTLKCADGHSFDSWFASGAEFERLSGSALLSCAVCGGGGIEKDLMAPGVRTGGDTSLTAPASTAERALGALRRKIEATAENVGRNFATEARRIHEGEAPARPIIGEARLAEARALVEDGVPIAPLPWGPPRKVN